MTYMTDAERLELINGTTQLVKLVIRYKNCHGIEIEGLVSDVNEALYMSGVVIKAKASYAEIFRINQQTGELIATIGAWHMSYTEMRKVEKTS